MRVMLVSGLSLDVKRLCLYDEIKVTEILRLRARAAKALGGRGLGLSVIGAPGLTFAAEAASMSLLSHLISSATENAAFVQLAEAKNKYEVLLKAGVYLSVSEISGLESPDPSAWLGWRDQTRYIHNGDEFLSVETVSATVMIRWRDVCAYHAPPSAQILDKQEIKSRWVSIPAPTTKPTKIEKYGGFRYGRHSDGSISVREAGELIGFPSAEDFKKWADQNPHKK